MERKRWPARALMRILASHGRKCQMCRCDIDPSTGYELDHKIPLALGGEDCVTNLQPLCVRCHRLKTKGDVGRISKAKRQEVKALTKIQPRQKIPQRPKPPRPIRDKLPLPPRQPMYE